jgi:hypothetical protein
MLPFTQRWRIVKIARLATKLLGPPEEIGGRDPRASRFRWTILGNHHFKLYLYRFVGDGWSAGPGYPQWFISAGLAKSSKGEAAKTVYSFPNGTAWMLQIGKASQGGEDSPRD